MEISIRNIGSYARNPLILQRYANALSFSKRLMAKYDPMSLVIQRSGKHVKQNAQNDLKKIVIELMEQKAFQFTPGRTSVITVAFLILSCITLISEGFFMTQKIVG